MNSAALSRVATRAAGPIGLIGAVGGFVADVMAPLGQFAPAVAVLSLVAAVIFALLTVRESRNHRHDIWDTAYSGGLFVSIASVFVFTLWSLVLGAGPERGYLAENIDPIARIQAQLLGIEEDVAEIRETTTQTAEDVETIATVQAEDSEDIDAIATAQAQGFADIQAAFAALQQSETIVENPTTPQEFYSNARLYQIKGNTAEAINAYEGYLAFNLEYVDPVQDYADLLKATEGISRAREILSARLTANPGSLVTDYVAAAMLETADDRIARFQALTSRAPDFGPAYLGLGQAIEGKLAEAGGIQILTAQLIETYERLRDLENDQNFTRYFIDKSRAVTQYETAMRSLEMRAGAQEGNQFTRPSVLIQPGQAGYTFVFVIADVVKEWFVAFDDPAALRTLGTINSSIGSTANSALVDHPVDIGEHVLYYRYVDNNGAESELFEEPFTVYPITAYFTPEPTDFATGMGSTGVIVYAYQRPYEESYTFYWGLSEDDVDNPADTPPFSLASFKIADLAPGDYTLYVRAEGPGGEELGPYPFPFTIGS